MWRDREQHEGNENVPRMHSLGPTYGKVIISIDMSLARALSAHPYDFSKYTYCPMTMNVLVRTNITGNGHILVELLKVTKSNFQPSRAR